MAIDEIFDDEVFDFEDISIYEDDISILIEGIDGDED